MSTVNSGVAIRVLPRTVFNMLGLSNGGTAAFLIARHIDITPFTEAEFLVRVHSGTSITGTGPGMFQVQPVIDAYDFADPATDFNLPVAGATTTINSGTAVPSVAVLNVGTTFGRLLGIQLTGTGGASMSALSLALSLDLIVKGGDPAAISGMPNAFRGYRII